LCDQRSPAGGHQSRKTFSENVFLGKEEQHAGEGHQDSFVMICVVSYSRC